MLTEQERQLATISFDESHDGVCLLGEAEKEFQAALVAKGVICNKAKKELKLASGRIEACPNKEAFEIDMKKIDFNTAEIQNLYVRLIV